MTEQSTMPAYAGDAAYFESLYERYRDNPSSVNADWARYFQALAEEPVDVAKSGQGPSWQKPNWPVAANGELVSALDGNWAAMEKAAGDKIKFDADRVNGQITVTKLQKTK